MSKVIAIFVVFSLAVTFGGVLGAIVSNNNPGAFTYDFETVLCRELSTVPEISGL